MAREDVASAYIPMDRRQALARGAALPARPTGTMLFADISGFTTLTESLVARLGPRLGAEELARQLNRVYDALVAEVHRFGGSVLGFAGDAMTCWFGEWGFESDDPRPPSRAAAPNAALRAITCAFAAQAAMRPFASVPLAVKIGLASGPVLRCLAGDPAIQYIDVAAGATLARMAAVEEQAHKGEVLADEATAATLGAAVRLGAWRDTPAGERCVVVTEVSSPVSPTPWPALPAPLALEDCRPWLSPAVYVRLRDGLGEFPPELRPAISLFLGFSGIDYDADVDAPARLDDFMRSVQAVLARHDGTLVQVTIGDKGSYLYSAFGAPTAHEDDARRACSAALELVRLGDPQIGVAVGTVRAGAYGGQAARTYGALGDAVNVAARLMQHAAPGSVLASARVRRMAGHAFTWEPLPPLRVKGKREPLTAARLAGVAGATSEALAPESTALVGREAELDVLAGFLRPLAAGRPAGLVYVDGEAGIGKSRIVRELRRRLAAGPAPVPQWFVCPAESILRQSLSPFRHFLRGYFGQRSGEPSEVNRARFDAALDARLAGLPPGVRDELDRGRSLLAALVDLHWDGSLYERLDPRLRFENTLIAFKALVRAESLRAPVVLHVEDAHEMDADSQELVRALVRPAAGADSYPVAVVLTARPRDDGSRFRIPVDDATPQEAVELGALNAREVLTLAAAVLEREPSDTLAALLREKTGGNPLFVEQLALDLRERQGEQLPDGDWTRVADDSGELPESIAAVLLARLDRLGAQVKAVVQTAAVLGQEFDVRVLERMCSGDAEIWARVDRAESERVWSAPDPARYVFRHALLRDTAYSMQLQDRLQALHALAAGAIEQLGTDQATGRYASLAYHYGRAGDAGRERHYARLAGEEAAADYANTEAVRHFTRALELCPASESQERYALLAAREQVCDVQGARTDQARDLAALEALAEALGTAASAAVALRRANFAFVTGAYPETVAAAQRARTLAETAGDRAAQAEAHRLWGLALLHTADYAGARTQLERALESARAAADTAAESAALSALGLVAFERGDYAEAQGHHAGALRLCRSSGDRREEGAALNNLGLVARLQSDFAGARAYEEQALALYRELGDRRGESIALDNLGNVARNAGDFTAARAYQEQALALYRELGDRRGESIALNNLGMVAWHLGDLDTARMSFERSLRLKRALGDRRGEAIALGCLGSVLDARGNYSEAQATEEEALCLTREIGDRRGEANVLANLALIAHHLGDQAGAGAQAADAARAAAGLGDRATHARALLVLGHARLAAAEAAAAAEAYGEALALRRALGQGAPAAEALVGLADASLAQGHLAEARALVEEALTLLDGDPPHGAVEPARVLATCARVLAAAGDPHTPLTWP